MNKFPQTESAISSDPPSVLERDVLARAIVETVPTPLIVLDDEYRIRSVNPAFARAYRTKAVDLLERSLFDIQGGAWDQPDLRSALEDVLPRESRIRDMEVRVPIPDVGVRTLRVSARQVRHEGAGMELILFSTEDVTQYHLYEKRIEAYARDLERSNRDLESFAHAASHDLQEPLRKIHTYTDRITAALDVASLDERTRRYLERMPEAVGRMQRRIDDLLLYARLARSEPDRQPTDLNTLVSETLQDLEIAMNESDARVDVGPLPTLPTDASQMQLLFQNLIGNSIKFAKKGQAPVVRISQEGDNTDATGSMATIVLEDDGIGFEQQYAERIFLPFHRLHGREEYTGTGVGLAICRRIAEAHHGTLVAESQPGAGARFVLNLPVNRDPETPR